MNNIEQLINAIIIREGGYVNNKADKGGPTKFGITQATLSSWRKKPATITDVKNLTKKEAYDIYYQRYVVKPRFLELKDSVLIEQVVDAGVNHGIGAATQMLQQCLGIEADGVLGPITLAAINKTDKKKLALKFLARRIRYFANILEKNKSQLVFAAGWFNRCAEMLERASG